MSHNLARCSKQSVIVIFSPLSTSHFPLLILIFSAPQHLFICWIQTLVSTICFYLMSECSVICSGVSHNLARHSGQSWLCPFTNTSGLDSHGCTLICFGVSCNLVRCFKQSVVVIGFSHLLALVLWLSSSGSWHLTFDFCSAPPLAMPFHFLDPNIGEYNLFLLYVWTPCDCSGMSCNLVRHSRQSWLCPFTNASGLDSHGCILIRFGVSHNLARHSEQSVIVVGFS